MKKEARWILTLLLAGLSTLTVQAAAIISLQGNLNTGTGNINFTKPAETVAGEVRFYTNGFTSAIITNGTPGTGGSYTGPTMYGAFRHSRTGGAPATFTTFRYTAADQIQFTPGSTTAAEELDYLFVFKQAQFANGLSTGNVKFAASSMVTLTSSVYNANTKSMRAAVQNNGTWYISQTENTNLSGNVRTINLTTNSMWAAWAPMASVPGSFTVPGSQLTDVEAVGLYGHLIKTNNGTIFSLTLTSISIDGFVSASQPAQPIDVPAYALDVREVWTNGTMKTPSAIRLGRQSASSLSACVMAFELPDLSGASIVSANLKFTVGSVFGSMNSNYNFNVHLETIRGAPMGSAVVSNDYRVIGLRAGESNIQSDIVVWTNGAGNYQTTGSATNTLGAWLTQQYANTNAGIGGVVFLRLAVDRDPTNSIYYNLTADQVSLTITTDGNVTPARGFGNTVSVRMGANVFSWTVDQNVEWGHFIDGQPWVVIPPSGYLSLVSATPARLNNQSVKYFITAASSGTTNADINITVRNPPFDHTFNGTVYIDNTNGVFGWDSRRADLSASPKYNASLGWNGSTYLALSGGDSITTAKSTIQNLMPDRATTLDSLAVLTVLTNVPPDDAFRPGIIRSGTDRTSPEILTYSSLINLSPYLISNPVGVTTDLRGTNVASIDAKFMMKQLRLLLTGPGFINTGYSTSEGASARFNTYAYPSPDSTSGYGGNVGSYMGQLAIGALAGWLSPEERKSCQIRFIQRAIDSYCAVKAGLCMEEGCGIQPGYSTLITTAGAMLNHSGMKNVNNGVNGVQPWFIFADYACHFHTDGISTNDLAAGEAMSDRQISLYSSTTNNYPELNRTNVQPIAAASASTMTMKTNFYWCGSRPVYDIINLKVKITGGAGAGSTIYVITNAITATNLVTDAEKFRTAAGVLLTNSAVYGYCYGGKVGVKPVWQNGTPNSNSVLAFSITTKDTNNILSDIAEWYWCPDGVLPGNNPVTFERVKSIGTSPIAEYNNVHEGATICQLIALYALGQQNLYKGGADKYLINASTRPGFAEAFFGSLYVADGLGAGANGSTLGALWKQEVLSAVGATFQYTIGGTNSTGALSVPNPTAKMWYEQ